MADPEMIESDVLVNEYNPHKSVRLSTDLFNVSKTISKLGNSHSVKLLYAIAQAVQSQSLDSGSIKYRLDISVSAVFDYLGVQTSGMRYDYLRLALKEIQDNSLQVIEKTPRGGLRYRGVSWISGYDFSTDKERLIISIGDFASPYLIQLSQYASIKPIDYKGLNTAYQLWVYPFLKDKEKLGTFRVKIDDLKKMLDADNKPTYTDPVFGTNKFLLKVLGITISEQAKTEAKLAKKEKRISRFVAWDYARDSQGKPLGTLYNINRCTDLNVYARAVKQGRSYVEVEFKFNQRGSQGFQLYYPEALPPSEQRPEGQEEAKDWVWVVQSEEDIESMIESYGFDSRERLLAMNPRTLQIRNGVIRKFKKIPNFFE